VQSCDRDVAPHGHEVGDQGLCPWGSILALFLTIIIIADVYAQSTLALQTEKGTWSIIFTGIEGMPGTLKLSPGKTGLKGQIIIYGSSGITPIYYEAGGGGGPIQYSEYQLLKMSLPFGKWVTLVNPTFDYKPNRLTFEFAGNERSNFKVDASIVGDEIHGSITWTRLVEYPYPISTHSAWSFIANKISLKDLHQHQD
jgi:hypothetical protein